MTRIVFVCLLLALSSLTTTAQVIIHISPKHQKKYETIRASVENTGSKPVTFCIEVGQTSPKGGGAIEATPSPFWVQRNNNGNWGTLMIGPDVGSFRSPNVLESGKSVEFNFRMGESGQMRLRMNYWSGSFPSLDCHATSKGARVITSEIFTVE